MKNSIFVVAMLIVLGMTSCAASENDPMEQVENIDMLSTYGARNVSASDKNFKNLSLEELPPISVSEANDILASIRKHSQSQKHFDVKENLHGDHSDIDVMMDETVCNKYTFTIQLHMQKDSQKGTMYYKSYEANCSASSFAWYIKGFSFSTDNTTGDNKFESPSYLYFKVMGDELNYIQVPVTVKGTYCPNDNKAEFSYVL